MTEETCEPEANWLVLLKVVGLGLCQGGTQEGEEGG